VAAARRVNCLIGPGEARKSTILSPTTSEYDYVQRRVDDGFQITAVLATSTSRPARACARRPCMAGSTANSNRYQTTVPEAVLVARVSGSPELELSHVLVAPGDAD